MAERLIQKVTVDCKACTFGKEFGGKSLLVRTHPKAASYWSTAVYWLKHRFSLPRKSMSKIIDRSDMTSTNRGR